MVWKSSKETWCRLHEEAFRYFGGCTQYVTLDNLKEGVIKPDIYDPELNSLYAAVLKHYNEQATRTVYDDGTILSSITLCRFARRTNVRAKSD